MAQIIDARIMETSTSTGTGPMALAAAVTGFRRFNEVVVQSGDTAPYLIEAVDANGVPTGQWEIGIATLGNDTLTRTLVLRSSAGPNVLNFAAGTKRISIVSLPGANDWKDIKLDADYTNATVTFANITDASNILTFTPPANSDWEMEARLLVWTTATANLPRVGFLVGAGATRGNGGVNIWQAGATAITSVSANGAWSDAAGITVAQIAAGGVLTASVPYLCEVLATGRSGAAPTAISLQMACETAAANTCFIKRGSYLKYRIM